MTENKTVPTDVAVESFLATVDDATKRAEAQELDALFRRVTGWQPRMWGPSMVGYGRYHYRYESGREGDALATGFSPRKAEHSIYVMSGYDGYPDLMARLGKHRIGKSCLYVKRLSDIDLTVLEELVRRGLHDLGKKYPVTAE